MGIPYICIACHAVVSATGETLALVVLALYILSSMLILQEVLVFPPAIDLWDASWADSTFGGLASGMCRQRPCLLLLWVDCLCFNLPQMLVPIA